MGCTDLRSIIKIIRQATHCRSYLITEVALAFMDTANECRFSKEKEHFCSLFGGASKHIMLFFILLFHILILHVGYWLSIQVKSRAEEKGNEAAALGIHWATILEVDIELNILIEGKLQKNIDQVVGPGYPIKYS